MKSSKLEELRTRLYLDCLGLYEIFINAGAKITRKLGLRKDSNLQKSPLKCRALITGGNAGVGRATAAEFIRRGGDVTLACRNRRAAEATADELRSLIPYENCQIGSVDVTDLDLASLASVKMAVSMLASERKLFNYIICNAGIMAPPKRLETIDGFERQFQVNYLSHFALVHGLLRQCKTLYTSQNIQPRCVFLTSLVHFAATTLAEDLDGDLQAKKKYNPFKQYANSKFCQLVAAKEFNRRLDGQGTFPRGTAVACHPGIVDTYLAKEYFKGEVPKMLRPLVVPVLEKVLFPMFLKSPEDAAESVLFACTAPAKKVGGKYIQEGAVTRCSAASDDLVLAQRIWKRSEELAGLETAT